MEEGTKVMPQSERKVLRSLFLKTGVISAKTHSPRMREPERIACRMDAAEDSAHCGSCVMTSRTTLESIAVLKRQDFLVWYSDKILQKPRLEFGNDPAKRRRDQGRLLFPQLSFRFLHGN